MSLEIDMLKVSQGDALVVRYVNPRTGAEWVGVIDGGRTNEDGDLVAQHVATYTTTQKINDLICTHPDADHIGGLTRVVQRLAVDRAWIHDPGKHIDFNDLTYRLKQRSYLSAAKKIYRSMEQCSDFLKLLDMQGIARAEPFAGAVAGGLEIVGPREGYYEELLQNFDDLEGIFVEDERQEAVTEEQRVKSAPDEVIDEDNTTSAENNSSVICRLTYDGDIYLFTGDAGVPALENAILDYDISNIQWLDAPHHGSKHNVCSSILDSLQPGATYFSAQGTRKHPSRAVINALKRRGCRCYSTHKNGSLRHRRDAPQRQGWTTAEPL